MVVIPPLLALIAVSYLTVSQALSQKQDAEFIGEEVNIVVNGILKIVHGYQRERGISCVYVSRYDK